jgi:hypothetical protein
MFPTQWLANSVEHDRLIAEEVFRATQCDVNARANELGVDVTSVWRRAFRYRAEREATANALRVREGKPIETASRCSDGGWTYEGTTLRFSREIATAAPDRPMPLVLRVKPSNRSREHDAAQPPHAFRARPQVDCGEERCSRLGQRAPAAVRPSGPGRDSGPVARRP